MSRSGYSDDWDNGNWALAMWRGQVTSATRGKRGQSFLKELLAVMDAMPQRRLIKNSFMAEGEFCTLGVIGRARGVDMTALNKSAEDSDDYFYDGIARKAGEVFNIARQLSAEIMYMNDEGEWGGQETPEARWNRMRKWVDDQIIPAQLPPRSKG